VAVLEKSLLKNFQYAQVSVVDCPDLSLDPFMLASKGRPVGVGTVGRPIVGSK